MRIVLAVVVDLLPIDWWKPGNLHFVGSHTLHFCSAPDPLQRSVRTVEWDDKEVGRGRKPFPLDRWDQTEQ